MIKNKSSKYEGIVLSYRSYKENDKLVTILCKESGKKSFIARGALKPTSSFGGKLEPVTRIVFLASGSGELKFISEVRELSPYINIKSRVSIFKRVCVIIEIIKKIYLMENHDDQFYPLLIDYLEIFNKLSITGEVADCLLLSFKLNLLEIEGMGLNFDYCSECGSQNSTKFLSENGEILCELCSGKRIKFSLSSFREEINYLINMREIGIRKRLFNTILSTELSKIIDIFFRTNIDIELFTEKYFKISV